MRGKIENFRLGEDEIVYIKREKLYEIEKVDFTSNVYNLEIMNFDCSNTLKNLKSLSKVTYIYIF